MINCMTKVDAAIKKADSCMNLGGKQIASKLMRGRVLKWFGILNDDQYDHVKDVIRCMGMGVAKGKLILTYHTTEKAPGLYGEAQPPAKSGWAAQEPWDFARVAYRIDIYPPIWDLDQDRTGRLGPKSALMHELSHIYGNTNDIKESHVAGTQKVTEVGTGEVYYGPYWAAELKRNHPGLGIWNAENYALFLRTFLDPPIF